MASDEYIPPCDGKWQIYFRLIDAVGTTNATLNAAYDALTLCRTCKVQTQCWAKAEAEGETWVEWVKNEQQRQDEWYAAQDAVETEDAEDVA